MTAVPNLDALKALYGANVGIPTSESGYVNSDGSVCWDGGAPPAPGTSLYAIDPGRPEGGLLRAAAAAQRQAFGLDSTLAAQIDALADIAETRVVEPNREIPSPVEQASSAHQRDTWCPACYRPVALGAVCAGCPGWSPG